MTHITNVNDLYSLYGLNPDNQADGITYWLVNDKKWAALDKYYPIIEGLNGLNSQWTGYFPPEWTISDTTGGWFLSSDSIVFSDSTPYGDAAEGSQWVWTENNAINDYDSVITYTCKKIMIDWNEYSILWQETEARMRVHNDTPSSVYCYPNSPREKWLDTSTGILYIAFNGGWITDGGISG